jgi:hypothetical protein
LESLHLFTHSRGSRAKSTTIPIGNRTSASKPSPSSNILSSNGSQTKGNRSRSRLSNRGSRTKTNNKSVPSDNGSQTEPGDNHNALSNSSGQSQNQQQERYYLFNRSYPTIGIAINISM